MACRPESPLASDNEHGCCGVHREGPLVAESTYGTNSAEQVWGTRCCYSASHQCPRTRAVTEFRYDEGNPFGRCCFDRKRGFRSVSPIGFGSRTKKSGRDERGGGKRRRR